jgi:hypothetical protein
MQLNLFSAFYNRQVHFIFFGQAQSSGVTSQNINASRAANTRDDGSINIGVGFFFSRYRISKENEKRTR